MILYNNTEVHFGKFPNGEVNLKKIKIEPQNLNHVVTLKYENDADLFHLLMIRQELDNVPLDVPVILRITYAPYSRMDRDNGVYSFSLKVFTQFINSMDWDKVIIYEPHSDVLPALLDRVQVVDVTASPLMQSKLKLWFGDEDYQICYPDVGAFKRYSDKFKTGDPLTGFKVRDFETGKILALNIEGIKNSDNIAIVDDLCSKGGTFVLAAKRLRAMGFKRIVLVVAHCENTIFDGEIFSSGLIEKVITTDSILDYVEKEYELVTLRLTDFKWN